MTSNMTTDKEWSGQSEDLCDADFPIFTGTLFIFIFIISVIGNGLVLCVFFFTYYQQKRVTNIFILNLACSDLIFTVTLPFWATYYLHHWVFGDFVCKFITAAYFVGLYSSVILLTVITVDRFILVVLPLRRHCCRVRRCAVGACIAAWVISISASLSDAIKAKVVNWDNVNYCVVGSDDNLGYYLQISLLFFLPLAIIIFCSSAMLKKIIQIQNRSRKRNSLRHKAAIQILGVVAVFFICWGPYNNLLIIRSLYTPKGCKAQQQLNIAFHFCELLAYSHCCMNPLLYIWSQKSRNDLLNLLCCKHVSRKNRRERHGQNALFNQNVAFIAQRPEDGTAL